jgi:glycosyltransferase involved in cell wall biosynthesis
LYATTVAQSVRFLTGQIRFMQEHGFRVAVLSSPGKELTSIAIAEGAEVIPIPMCRRPAPFRDLVSLARVCLKLRKVKPTIVCAGTPKAGLLVMIAAALWGVPRRIYQIRGLPISTMRGWRRAVFAALEQLACSLAHEVICVSASVRDEAVRTGLVQPRKALVLGNGSSNGVDALGQYDPDRVLSSNPRQLRTTLKVPAEALVIGFVGRLVRDKGIIDLSEAWARVRIANPDAYLLIIGPYERSDSVPAEVLSKLKADDRVRVVSDCREAAPYYAAMDLLVHPSHREGFPNVVLEASAMRLPVITTDAIGCIDSVVDGTTGTVVPARDPERLALAVMRYLSDPQLRRQHGDAGRRRVLRDFVPSHIWMAMHDRFTVPAKRPRA